MYKLFVSSDSGRVVHGAVHYKAFLNGETELSLLIGTIRDESFVFFVRW